MSTKKRRQGERARGRSRLGWCSARTPCAVRGAGAAWAGRVAAAAEAGIRRLVCVGPNEGEGCLGDPRGLICSKGAQTRVPAIYLVI